MTKPAASTASRKTTTLAGGVCPASGKNLAGGYVRISLDNLSGTEDQFFITAQRAEKDGYTIPAGDELFQYVDNDATGKNSDREGLQRLLDLMLEIVQSNGTKKAPFDRLYVKDRTRLGRWNDPREHSFIEVLCKKAGVTVCYCDEKIISYDDAEASEITAPFLLGQIANLNASAERRKIVKRTREGCRSAAVKGLYPGSRPAYGMERWLTNKLTGAVMEKVPRGRILKSEGCGYTLRPATDGTARVVQDVFRRFEAGETMNAIAADLNKERVPPPGATGNRVVEGCRWTNGAVRHILTNPVYVGDMYWGRRGNADLLDRAEPQEFLDVQGRASIVKIGVLADALVSRERWVNVQRKLQGNASDQIAHKANKAEFSVSSVLRCTSCGGALYGFTKKNRLAGEVRYYRHDSTQRHPQKKMCAHGNRYLRADEVEPVVDGIVKQVLSDGSLLERANTELRARLSASEEQARGQELDALRKTRAGVAARKKQAARDSVDSSSATARATFHEVVEELSREQDQLDARIRAADEAQALRSRVREKLDSTLAGYADCYERYLSHDAAKRKAVVREICESILVDLDARALELRVRVA